jgi:hypothetical protein
MSNDGSLDFYISARQVARGLRMLGMKYSRSTPTDMLEGMARDPGIVRAVVLTVNAFGIRQRARQPIHRQTVVVVVVARFAHCHRRVNP